MSQSRQTSLKSSPTSNPSPVSQDPKSKTGSAKSIHPYYQVKSKINKFQVSTHLLSQVPRQKKRDSEVQSKSSQIKSHPSHILSKGPSQDSVSQWRQTSLKSSPKSNPSFIRHAPILNKPARPVEHQEYYQTLQPKTLSANRFSQ